MVGSYVWHLYIVVSVWAKFNSCVYVNICVNMYSCTHTLDILT